MLILPVHIPSPICAESRITVVGRTALHGTVLRKFGEEPPGCGFELVIVVWAGIPEARGNVFPSRSYSVMQTHSADARVRLRHVLGAWNCGWDFQLGSGWGRQQEELAKAERRNWDRR